MAALLGIFKTLNFHRVMSVWHRNFTVYRRLYKSSLVLNFVDPILYLVAFGMGFANYVKEIQGLPYVKFIAPAIVATSSAFATTYECTYGTFVRMHFQKTFDAILATPVNVYELIMGEMLWGATKSLIYGMIIMIVIMAGGLVNSETVLLALPFVFLSGIVFAEISLIVTSIVPGIDSFNYFYTLFITPLFLFSGLFFPLDDMPVIFQKLAFFNPMYHEIEILRGFAFKGGREVVDNMLWLFSAAILLLLPPFKTLKRRILR